MSRFHPANFGGRYDAVPIDHLPGLEPGSAMPMDVESLRLYADAANAGSFLAIQRLVRVLSHQVSKGPDTLSDEVLTILWVTARLSIPQLITRSVLESGTRRCFYASSLLHTIHLLDPTTVDLIPWEVLPHGGLVEGVKCGPNPDPDDGWPWWSTATGEAWRRRAEDEPAEDASSQERYLAAWRPKLKRLWDEAMARAVAV